MSVLSSPEIITAAENTAIQKISFSTRKTLTLAILAGIYIAMGGLLSLVIGYGFPEITTNNPGLQRLLSGAMFPLGLILVVFAGAELFTGNNAVLIPGLCNHKYGLIPVLRNWLLVYIGNFIGAIFFVYVMVYLADIVKSDTEYRRSKGRYVMGCYFHQRNRGKLVCMSGRMVGNSLPQRSRKVHRPMVSRDVFRGSRLRA